MLVYISASLPLIQTVHGPYVVSYTVQCQHSFSLEPLVLLTYLALLDVI